MSDQFWTAGDIAREARISHQAVIDATRKGWLVPAGRTAGGIRIYLGRDAARFISERQERAKYKHGSEGCRVPPRKPMPKKMAGRE